LDDTDRAMFLGVLAEVISRFGRIIRSLQWYKHQHRNPKVAMAKAYESGAYTLAQIVGHFAVHYSTVSRAVKQPDRICLFWQQPPK
jgi:hypothetical protein